MQRPSSNMLLLSMLADMALGFSTAAFVFGHTTLGFAVLAGALAAELVRALDREGRLRRHRRSALERVLDRQAARERERRS